MPRTPRPLTSALAAALAAGTVVAVGAVADPGADRPVKASAPKGWRAAPPPTREEAVRVAAEARDDIERRVAGDLGIEPAKVRAGARTLVVRRLGEEVDAERLTAAQRDALLACFDDPVGCDRRGLPVARRTGAPLFAGELVVPPAARPPLPRAAAGEKARARARARSRARSRRGRRAPARPAPTLVSGPESELAKELGVEREALMRALRRADRERPGGRLGLDPDGVPIGLPSLPVSLVVPVPSMLPMTRPAVPAPRPRVRTTPAAPPLPAPAPPPARSAP